MKHLLLITAFVSSFAFGQEIKGIEIGKLPPADIDNHRTVAGAASKYSGSIKKGMELRPDGTVRSFAFFFDPKDFDQVLIAMKTKYPELHCQESTVTTGMGVRHEQVVCRYRQLSLRRFITDVNTSVLALLDQEELSQKTKEANERAKADL